MANLNTGYYDEAGFHPDQQTVTADMFSALPGYKPWDFGTSLGGYREPGNASLRSADNPELSGYFQQKYGGAMDQAYRNQMANIQNSGGFQLWNADTGEAAGLDPRTWDQLLMPAFQASGAAADPRFGEYQNLWKNVQSSGQAVDAANAAAIDAAHKKKVMAGIAAVGSVMGAGALGFLGGGAGELGGLAAAGGGIPEASWGVMQGLSPEALSALGTGGAIDVGGSGLTMAEWLAAQQAPFAGMGGVGAGQLGAGGLGLGSFGGGGFGVGGNTAIEAGANMPGAGAAPGGGGGTPQTPTSPGFSGTPGGGGGQWPGTTGPGGSLSPGASQAITAPPGNAPLAAASSSVTGAAGQGGGGDFVSGILDQFKKNALSLGMMGLSLAGVGSQQGKTPPAVGKLEANSNVSSDLARQYLAAAQSGQLTGPQQASLDQYKQQAKNQIRQYFSSIGQFDSTSRIQAEAQIDQTAVAMQQQLVQQTLANGLSLMNASNTPLAQVAQYQMGQDQALVNAMGSFAQGIGSLFGQQAGQGQINRGTQATQNPPYPPNAGPQPPVITSAADNLPPYIEPIAP